MKVCFSNRSSVTFDRNAGTEWQVVRNANIFLSIFVAKGVSSNSRESPRHWTTDNKRELWIGTNVSAINKGTFSPEK
jgi:hypothetical protein